MPDRFDDPVIAEIHATRAAMLAAAGGDIRVLMQQVAERQRKSKHRIITRPLRDRTEPSVAPESPIARVPNGQSNPATG
jgi:hypothetical protein